MVDGKKSEQGGRRYRVKQSSQPGHAASRAMQPAGPCSQPGHAASRAMQVLHAPAPPHPSWADVYLAGLRVDRGRSTANKDNSKGTDTKRGTALSQALAW